LLEEEDLLARAPLDDEVNATTICTSSTPYPNETPLLRVQAPSCCFPALDLVSIRRLPMRPSGDPLTACGKTHPVADPTGHIVITNDKTYL